MASIAVRFFTGSVVRTRVGSHCGKVVAQDTENTVMVKWDATGKTTRAWRSDLFDLGRVRKDTRQ